MRAAEPELSIEEFLELRFDLPESGQWSELVAGHPVHLQPPDLDHGNTVLNLSKVLAEYSARTEGYPCFDLGLLIRRAPDTAWFPAISYFDTGPRFAQTDEVVTDVVPAAVIELASTADRRAPMADRVQRYLQWGVRDVWVIDPRERSVEIVAAGAAQCWKCGDVLVGDNSFAGLELPVTTLFAEPQWWSQAGQ